MIGDYNTAHRVIDLAHPQANVTHSGFLPEERAELDRWIDAGWVDVFRTLHPEEPGQYTWWRQWGGARERNIGWRIDYVFASPAAMRRIHEAFLWSAERGSQVCPAEVGPSLCRRRELLFVDAFEIDDAAPVEPPDTGPDFLEQILVVRDEEHRSFVALECHVQRVDRF